MTRRARQRTADTLAARRPVRPALVLMALLAACSPPTTAASVPHVGARPGECEHRPPGRPVSSLGCPGSRDPAFFALRRRHYRQHPIAGMMRYVGPNRRRILVLPLLMAAAACSNGSSPHTSAATDTPHTATSFATGSAADTSLPQPALLPLPPQAAVPGSPHPCGDIPYAMSTLHDYALTNCWYSYATAKPVERWLIAGRDPAGFGILGSVSNTAPFSLFRVPGHHGATTIESLHYARVCFRNADGTRGGYDADRKKFSACPAR